MKSDNLSSFAEDTSRPVARQALEDALIGERGGDRKSDEIKGMNHTFDSDSPSRPVQTKSLRRLRREFPALED